MKEVCNIEKEAVIKSFHKKKKFKKPKWLSEEALQTAMKRRDEKGKGEKEEDIPFECRVPRLARRDKKAFLSDQCKETEENNRMGKTRDLFKKIRDTKGTFNAKMDSVKNRNGRDLTETEDMKKQKNYTKKIFMTQIITMM